MTDIKIAGQKLLLRDFQIDDLDRYAHWLQPEHQWHKLNGPYYPTTVPEEIIEKLRERILSAKNTIPRRRLVISEHENDDFINTFAKKKKVERALM